MSSEIPKSRKVWKLKAYAAQKLNVDDVFELTEEPLSELKDGEVLLRVDHLALEPTMRNSISERKSYQKPLPLGQPMWAFSISTVIASKDPSHAVGSIVFTNGTGWSTYAVVNPKNVPVFRQITKGAEDKPSFDPREYLASFGPPGLAAYVGLFSPKVGDFRKGDVVLVDGAAGATGRLVIQMAKARGASKIIAIASSKKEKAVLESGADVFVAHDQENFAEKLKEVAKEEVTLLFENVGGPVFEAALQVMAPHSRVALCGIISEYDSQPYGNKSMRSILINRIGIKGFICGDPEYACGQIEGIQQLLKEGKIHSIIHDFEPSGIENVPKALLGLFEGHNTGKMTIKISN